MNYENPLIPNLEPQDLPTECAALLYDRVSVSPIAQINVDYGKYFSDDFMFTVKIEKSYVLKPN